MKLVWFSIDFSSHVPVYKQIKEKIKALISTGTLKKGDFVPSIRSLADHLGVNMNTVARAYRELTLEGVIQPVRGEGYAVAELNKERFVGRLISEFKAVVVECQKAGIDQDTLIDVVKKVFWRDQNGPHS